MFSTDSTSSGQVFPQYLAPGGSGSIAMKLVNSWKLEFCSNTENYWAKTNTISHRGCPGREMSALASFTCCLLRYLTLIFSSGRHSWGSRSRTRRNYSTTLIKTVGFYRAQATTTTILYAIPGSRDSATRTEYGPKHQISRLTASDSRDKLQDYFLDIFGLIPGSKLNRRANEVRATSLNTIP